MKKRITTFAALLTLFFSACNNETATTAGSSTDRVSATTDGGQSNVKDDLSQKMW